MKTINILMLSAIIALLAMVSGCKKTNPTEQILVGFHFHTFIGGNLVDPVAYPLESYYDSATPPRLLHLTTAQFYISNIAIRVAGNWIPISNDVIMKRLNNEIYPAGGIPSGEMDSVKFTVGIGNGLNSQYPGSFSTTSPTDSVLSELEQTAMWGSAMSGMASMPTVSGYTFMNIQGYDSTNNLALNYQIGGYGDTVNVALGVSGGFNFSPILTGTNVNLIHIVADYGKLLQVLQTINSSNSSIQFWLPNSSATNNALLQNIKNMFRWECTPPINC